MKNLLTILLIIFSFCANAQTAPTPTNTQSKKTIKVGDKWYIETTITVKNYTELNLQLLLDTEKDDMNLKNEEAEVLRKQQERDKNKAERIERNKLLKEAIQKGYTPDPQTIEEAEKLKKIRTKLGIKN